MIKTCLLDNRCIVSYKYYMSVQINSEEEEEEQVDRCMEIVNQEETTVVVSESIIQAFKSHVDRLKTTRRQMKQHLKPRTVVDEEQLKNGISTK